MHTLTRRCFTYYNITVIDAEGKPTTTQLYTGDASLPIEWIANRVATFAYGNSRQRVIAAYLFDTHANRLHQFSVRNGKLVESAAEEATCGG